MRIAIFVLLFGTALFAERAIAEDYRVAPVPAWVTKVERPRKAIPSPTSSVPIHALLIDIQDHRAIDPPESFHHLALQAVNELGVPEVSQIQIDFQPAFETLLLHEATIHRRGVDIPIPIRGHVKVLHREERLADQIYDGRLTAVLLVDDVRPGDIVEWSYTLRGANPVLASHYAAAWSSTTRHPIDVLYRRLLWPAERSMSVRLRHSAIQPTVTRRGGTSEYDLRIENVPKVDVETDIPGWYDPTRSIHFSDVTSWGDVARWGTTLFEAPSTLTPELRARVLEFARRSGPHEDHAMAAVRFVQNDIRYLGIEIGENSHRATAPAIVLSRRFGDCKDKALLLVTFLRALGYEAHPALVNTSLRDSVGAIGPSALSFDHVIVRVKSGDRTYWIDATDPGQRGDAFARMSPPAFGFALVIGDSSRGLSRIAPDSSLALTTIEKTIEASRLDGPATLTVQTNYFGDRAGFMRLQVLARGREEMNRSFLEYYRNTYPKILELKPLLIEDDERLNHVRVTEQYSIPEFWQKEDDEEAPWANISAIELLGEVPSLRGEKRTMPLQIKSPHRTIYTASIQMPPEMSDLREETIVRTPALVMTTRKASEGQKLSIYHEFVRSRDYFTAEEALAAVKDFETMELTLLTELGEEQGGADAGVMTLLPWIMALMAAGLALTVVVRLFQAPAPAAIWPHTNYADGSEPWTPDQPIGGWLYVFGFGLIVAQFMNLYAAVTTLRDAGELMSLGLTGANARYEIVVLVATVLTFGLLVYGLGVLFLFARRRRVFFRAYVGAVVLATGSVLYDIVALQLMTPGDPETARQFLSLLGALTSFLIWATYFVRSRRVEATFVH